MNLTTLNLYTIQSMLLLLLFWNKMKKTTKHQKEVVEDGGNCN